MNINNTFNIVYDTPSIIKYQDRSATEVSLFFLMMYFVVDDLIFCFLLIDSVDMLVNLWKIMAITEYFL